ncbi:MAG: hypothetical protein R3277_08405 [Brumimicrobium sp.]|nr:hypothetical protein [Brumimicrobium sp.]
MLERIKFMKVNRHKRYDYTPRFYDERKERLNALIKNYEEKEDEFEPGSAEYRARLKERMERTWSLQSTQSGQSRAANIRLIVILAALLIATYFILNYVDIFTSEVTIVN